MNAFGVKKSADRDRRAHGRDPLSGELSLEIQAG
jgi:hypothetical protein